MGNSGYREGLLDNIDIRLLHPGSEHEHPIMLFCPQHEDRHKPSFGVYPKNAWCFSCGLSMGALQYIEHVLLERWRAGEVETDADLENDKRTRRQMVLALAEELQGDGTVSLVAGTTAKPVVNAGIVGAYEAALAERPAARKWLRKKYGLTDATIAEARLGYASNAFALPVFGVQGNLQTVRFRVDPEVVLQPRNKYWGLRGANQTLWYVPPALHGFTLLEGVEAFSGKRSVVVCEGEYDALALSQEGVAAVSATNGAKALTQVNDPLYKDLVGMRLVVLMFDQDAAGRAASEVVATNLASLGVPVQNLHWDPVLGKDPSELVAAGWSKNQFRELALKTLDTGESVQYNVA